MGYAVRSWPLAMLGVSILALVSAGSSQAAVTEQGAQARSAQAVLAQVAQAGPRRARTRIDVYPRGYSQPGPNSVRECQAWYVQEFRPSGTVVVPRMRCWWAPG